MSETEVREAIARICGRLDLQASRPVLLSRARRALVPALFGAGLVGVVACEGTTECRTGLPDGGAGRMDAGVGGDAGFADAGGTDPGPSDAYGIGVPSGGGGGSDGTGGSGGVAGG